MDGLSQILVLAGFLLAGALFVRIRAAPPPRFVDGLIKAVLWCLLFVMGFRIGNDRAVAARLGQIGLLALASAVFSVIGTIATILVGYALLGKLNKTPAKAKPQGESEPRGGKNLNERFRRFKAPAFLLALVALGFVFGLILPSLENVDFSAVTTVALDALLFLIGMQFVQSGVSLKGAFLKPETLMTPIATALGSLAGGLLLVPLFGLSIGKALSLSAGFGWYSLSGVLIADLGDGALGSAAFLANMIRESIAFLAIPILARGRFPGLAIGIGGATAMDVTLPLVEQCAGPEAVPASFASGALLSLSVPLLVPLFFRLG